jgi:hypothetical protein
LTFQFVLPKPRDSRNAVRVMPIDFEWNPFSARQTDREPCSYLYAGSSPAAAPGRICNSKSERVRRDLVFFEFRVPAGLYFPRAHLLGDRAFLRTWSHDLGFTIKTLPKFNRLSDLKIGTSGSCETKFPHLPWSWFLRKLFVQLQRDPIPSKAVSGLAFRRRFWAEENQEVWLRCQKIGDVLSGLEVIESKEVFPIHFFPHRSLFEAIATWTITETMRFWFTITVWRRNKGLNLEFSVHVSVYSIPSLIIWLISPRNQFFDFAMRKSVFRSKEISTNFMIAFLALMNGRFSPRCFSDPFVAIQFPRQIEHTI